MALTFCSRCNIISVSITAAPTAAAAAATVVVVVTVRLSCTVNVAGPWRRGGA